MVYYQVHDKLHSPLMDLSDQIVDISHGAIWWMYIFIICNIVALNSDVNFTAAIADFESELSVPCQLGEMRISEKAR